MITYGDDDDGHAQEDVCLVMRPLASGYPPMNRLKRWLKAGLRQHKFRCLTVEHLPRGERPRRRANEVFQDGAGI